MANDAVCMTRTVLEIVHTCKERARIRMQETVSSSSLMRDVRSEDIINAIATKDQAFWVCMTIKLNGSQIVGFKVFTRRLLVNFVNFIFNLSVLASFVIFFLCFSSSSIFSPLFFVSFSSPFFHSESFFFLHAF